MKWRFSIFRILPAVLAILIAACSSSDQDIGNVAAPLVFSSCRLPALSMAVECASLDVPLKRNDPAYQEKISLRIVRLPANTQHPDEDPFIILAGGPGQAASALAPFASTLVEIRRTRDILLIDQRGTGQSSPLTCAALDNEDDATLENIALIQELAPRARRCHEELRAQNIDPLDYGTLNFVADLENVRRALGLKKINLWAGSYGTRVALEYLRHHPENIRTMTLDGVVDPSVSIPLNGWQTRKERLQKLFDACAQSASCNALQPPPLHMLAALAHKLRTPGIKANIDNPNTGAPETITIDFNMMLAAAQSLLYAPETAALLPYLFARAYRDDYAPLAALTQSFSGELGEQMSPALHYAIICAEDRPVPGALSNDPLIGALYQQSVDACTSWPIAENAQELHTPVIAHRDIPVLLLSGALDPVTPPVYAQKAARTLPLHRTIIASGYGHILSTHACTPSLIAAFVRTADLEQLPSNCVRLLEESAPPFFWSDALAPQP